jgi:hypothetical protein
LKEELRGSQNRVLRKAFWPKGDKLTGEWKRLHKGELCTPNQYHSGIKSRRMRWAGHVERMEGQKRVLMGRPEGRKPLEGPTCRWGSY